MVRPADSIAAIWIAESGKEGDDAAADGNKIDFLKTAVDGSGPVLHDVDAGTSRNNPENDTPGLNIESNPDMGLAPFILTLQIKDPIGNNGIYPKLLIWAFGDNDDPTNFPNGKFGFRWDWDTAHNLKPSEHAGYKIDDLQYSLPGADRSYRRLTLKLRLGG